MKEAYFFSHDANARNDPKVLAMRSVYGSEGYGWFWIIVEMLREQENYRLSLGKYICNALAMQMQCSADAAHKFLQDCINEFELFRSDGECFWSESLLRRMEYKEAKSEKAKAAAAARWHKTGGEQPQEDADAMQTQCERNAKKGKESKVNIPYTDCPPDATEYERNVLKTLHSVKGYKADYSTDLDYIRKLQVQIPSVDVLTEATKWATYKLDKPLDKRSNPRSQFRNWCEIASSKRGQQRYDTRPMQRQTYASSDVTPELRSQLEAVVNR